MALRPSFWHFYVSKYDSWFTYGITHRENCGDVVVKRFKVRVTSCGSKAIYGEYGVPLVVSCLMT